MNFNIVEVFDSIEGEGKRSGAPATFVRLAGCNLRCTYCDTPYALEAIPGEYETRSLDALMKTLESRPFHRITLTGGEPLSAPGVAELIYQMLRHGNEVNIETNGSIDISFLLDYMKAMHYSPGKKLFFTMDYKLPSSGVCSHMLLPNYAKLQPWDVLKFVVGSDEDVAHMVAFLQTLTASPQIYIGAVHGQYDLQKLVATILETPELKDAKLQLQMHKVIWDAEERGV